jgi:hypothetical protein
MKNSTQDPQIHAFLPQDSPRTAEETLHLIATLPAPEGLEERVRASLRAAPGAARILRWPIGLPATGGSARVWMRSAAAAAIVCLVAGGGWGIYSHVQPKQLTKRVVMPPRVGAAGGFSSAGAIRTPQTLNGPVLLHPVTPAASPVTAQTGKTQVRRGKAAVGAPVRPTTGPTEK